VIKHIRVDMTKMILSFHPTDFYSSLAALTGIVRRVSANSEGGVRTEFQSLGDLHSPLMVEAADRRATAKRDPRVCICHCAEGSGDLD
jgi:hypothetical protein